MKKFLAQAVVSLIVVLVCNFTASAENLVAASQKDKAFMEAMDAWAAWKYESYPPMGQSEPCATLMKRVLLRLARVPQPVPEDFDVEAVVRPLKNLDCIDSHFYLRVARDRIRDVCKDPSVEMNRQDALWILKIRDFYDVDDEPQCPKRAESFQKVVNEIRVRSPRENAAPIILDLLDNGGSGPQFIVYLLDFLFSPALNVRLLTLNERLGWGNYSEIFSSRMIGMLACPRVMLINEYTASGGELFAAVMKQLCPQMVSIGQMTYKKGVGSEFHYVGGFRLQTSGGEYLSGPDDVKVNDVGVMPEIMVPVGEEMAAAITYIHDYPAP